MSNRKQRREIDKAVQHLMQFSEQNEQWVHLFEEFLSQMFGPLARRHAIDFDDVEQQVLGGHYGSMAFGYLFEEFATAAWDGAGYLAPAQQTAAVFGLSPASTYEFRARTHNPFGASEWGAVAAATTTEMSVPAAPTWAAAASTVDGYIAVMAVEEDCAAASLTWAQRKARASQERCMFGMGAIFLPEAAQRVAMVRSDCRRR